MIVIDLFLGKEEGISLAATTAEAMTVAVDQAKKALIQGGDTDSLVLYVFELAQGSVLPRECTSTETLHG